MRCALSVMRFARCYCMRDAAQSRAASGDAAVRPEFKVWASVDHAGALGAIATTNIWFGVGAPASRFVIPEPAEPERADDLWQTTCFEAFLRAAGARRLSRMEFRAVGRMGRLRFHRLPRGHDRCRGRPPPYIRMEDNLTWWALGATIAVAADSDWELGLSAVLEEKDGTKSYWALAHPPGDKPDFHDPDCFAARLALSSAP